MTTELPSPPENCPKCGGKLTFESDGVLEQYVCSNNHPEYKFNPKKEAWKKNFSSLKPTQLPSVHINCFFCKNKTSDKCKDSPNPDTCPVYEEVPNMSHSAKIVTLIDRESPTLFLDQYKNPFVWIRDNGKQRTLPLYSADFENICRDKFFRTFGKIPSREAVKDAFKTFEALSRNGETVDLRIRVANIQTENGLEIWIDPCNKNEQAYRITKDGYTIEDTVPPLFRRYEHMKSLPFPKKDGEDGKDGDMQNFYTPPSLLIHDKKEGGGVNNSNNSLSLASLPSLKYIPYIFNYLRVPEEDRLLILSALVSYFFLNTPFVIIYIHGESGKGKTLGSKFIQEIIDPTTTKILGLPHKEEELLQHISHRFFCSFDNVSYISDYFSDTFCRVSTGIGISKRKLYSDDTDFYRVLKRPLWFNGISVEVTREDMLKRTILSEALPIDGEEREENIINEEIEKFTPYILHELYNLVSHVIRIFPTVKPSKLFRMADYTRIGCAVAEALGYSQEVFIEKYGEKLSEQTKELIWNNTVGNVLYDYVINKGVKEWTETPTTLFKNLKFHAKEFVGVSTRSKDFPKAPPHLTRKINLLLEAFKKIGIVLDYRKGVIREWSILNKNFVEPIDPPKGIVCVDCKKGWGKHEIYSGNDGRLRCRECNEKYVEGEQ